MRHADLRQPLVLFVPMLFVLALAGSLVTTERTFIADLHARSVALKRQVVRPGDAGKQVASELKASIQTGRNASLTLCNESNPGRDIQDSGVLNLLPSKRRKLNQWRI